MTSIAELKSRRETFLSTFAKMQGWDGVSWKDAVSLLAPKVGRSEHGLRDLSKGRNHLHPDKVRALRESLGDQAEFLDPSCLLNPDSQGVKQAQKDGKKGGKPIREGRKTPEKSTPHKSVASPMSAPIKVERTLLSIREVDGEKAIILPDHVHITISTVGAALVITLRPGPT